ncbi:autotransporter outer membrane beta-barrel domain-containing protein [Hoeflea ulvae]|uniref:Autotransporter domain-containing protein n=1 Tax=Hoeflea ulvae TaxID=2983764 RepID=A0ABT3YM94_9HYPH|nr:autotransporter outer membrane beta-barrel domain-containing protein [Hoeflea ulvae]MCY0096963.1 autotransporter domain-containing protein [Hoeflea ulvae]
MTCDVNAPNPDTLGVNGFSISGVTVNLLDGAGIDVAGRRAIGLGANTTVILAPNSFINADATGGFSTGIFANGDNADIRVDGAISTTGTNVDGVAFQGDNNLRLIVTGTGSIVTTGDQSDAVASRFNPNLTATIEAGATLRTEGADSHGIGAGFNSTLDISGSITTLGDNSNAVDGGSMMVVTLRDGAVLSTAGRGSEGIRARGTITIENGAQVATTGDFADALFADSDSMITIGGVLSATGDSAESLFVLDNSTVLLTGTADLTGDVFIREGSSLTARDGATIDGLVTLRNNSQTDFAGSAEAIRSISSGVRINLEQTGRLTGNADSSATVQGDELADITIAGAVTGGAAGGIEARTGATVRVAPTGNVSVSNGGTGINIDESSGTAPQGASVVVEGTVSATGSSARGVRIRAASLDAAATRSVSIAGTVDVDGENSVGVFLPVPILGPPNIAPNFDLDISGTLAARGTGAVAIGISSPFISDDQFESGFDIDVAAGASVTSQSSAAIAAILPGPLGGPPQSGQAGFNTNISIAGTVSTGVLGGKVIDLQAGTDVVTLTPGAAITGIIDVGFDEDDFILTGATGTTGTFDFDQSPLLNFENFFKRGEGTWILDGSGATAGGTFNVDSGTLIVNGSLPAFVFDVAPAATVGGSGIIGGLPPIAGTIAPGSSGIGTLSVAGDLTFLAGSVFQTEIAGNGMSDLLATTGTATLNGGTVSVIALDPATSYQNGQRFTILTAAGGVTGQFAGAISQSAFITPTLDYTDPNAVALMISLAGAPVSNGCNPDPVGNGGRVTCTATDVDGFRTTSTEVSVTVNAGATVLGESTFLPPISVGDNGKITNNGTIDGGNATTSIFAGIGAETEIINNGTISNLKPNTDVVKGLQAAGTIINNGLIDVAGGILTTGVRAENGAMATNNAEVRFVAKRGTAMEAAGDGATVVNSMDGFVTVTSTSTSSADRVVGLEAGSAGSKAVNAGTITLTATLGGGFAAGLASNTRETALENTETGKINLTGSGVGIQVNNSKDAVNKGEVVVDASSLVADQYAIGARLGSAGVFTNSGTIRTISSGSRGTGIFFTQRGGGQVFTNTGLIESTGVGASGVLNYSTDVVLTNSGTISAAGTGSSGIQVGTTADGVFVDRETPVPFVRNTITNAGLIEGGATGIQMTGRPAAGVPTLTINNTAAGIIRATAGDGDGVSAIDANLDLTNAGEIAGIGSGKAIRTGGGNDVIRLLEGSRTLGGINFGAGDDTVVLYPTTQVSGSLNFGSGTDTLAFDGAAGTTGTIALFEAARVFANGFEKIEKRGAGTWIFGGDDLPAATPVSNARLLEGTTIVNANFRTVSATVDAGARLEGRGGSGTLTVNGTIAPGNSIGTFSVTGDLVIGPTGTLEAEISNTGLSDLLAVSGTATLNGGTVSMIALDPATSYRTGQTYTILTADGGITGRFASATTQSAFLTPTLDYTDPGSVKLAIAVGPVPLPGPGAGPNPGPVPVPGSLPELFPTVAQSFNQFQSATGLDDLGQTPGSDALAVYNQILMLNATQARNGFDLASGEVHASARSVAERSAGLFLQTLLNQGRTGLAAGGTGTPGASVALGYARTKRPDKIPSFRAAAGTPGMPADVDVPSAPTAWLAPLAGGGSIDGDGNAAGLDWYAGGFAGGYEGRDYAGSGSFLGGLAFGYVRSGADIEQRLSTIRSDALNLGIYGVWTDADWTISGAAGYTAAQISTERRIAFGTLDRLAEARYWNHTIAMSGEVARNFALGGVILSPFVSVHTGWSGHDSAHEIGAGALNLAVASAGEGWFDTGLGLAVARQYVTEGGSAIRLEARAAYEHGFGSSIKDQQLSFAGSPTAFAVRGPETGADRYRFGLGAAVQASPTIHFRARYDGMISSRETSHGGSVGLTVKF